MKTIDRIYELLSKHHISASRFSKDMGLSQSTVSSWYNRHSDPPVELFPKFAEYLGTTVEYLVTGNEECHDNTLLSEPERKLLSIYNQMSANSQNMLVEYAEELLDASTNLKITQ